MGAIYLIRHGQASFGAGDYDKLSKAGVEQAQVLGAALKARLPRVDAVVCGEMRRHRETAEHCLSAMGAPQRWETDSGWNEFDHDELIVRYKPSYANRTLLKLDLARTLNPRRAFQSMFDAAIERWVSGDHDAEYAEPWPQFKARVNDALQSLVGQIGSAQNALVFTSGGPISTIACAGFGVPDAGMPKLASRLANATVTKLVSGSRGVHVMTFNEHAHFEGAQSKLITYR